MLWARTPVRRWVLETTLCDKVCQWLETGTPVSCTNKTDRYDIAEILLKVSLNTIILTISLSYNMYICSNNTRSPCTRMAKLFNDLELYVRPCLIRCRTQLHFLNTCVRTLFYGGICITHLFGIICVVYFYCPVCQCYRYLWLLHLWLTGFLTIMWYLQWSCVVTTVLVSVRSTTIPGTVAIIHTIIVSIFTTYFSKCIFFKIKKNTYMSYIYTNQDTHTY